jgi:hypothetical protein
LKGYLKELRWGLGLAVIGLMLLLFLLWTSIR